jgi:hypothetical protein
MPTLTAPAHLGDLVKREFDANYCRETVTLHAGTDYPLGAVLGRITATGAYTLSPEASTAGLEGSEIACAVLLDAASAADTSAVALVRGPVIVADSALVFAATITTTLVKTAKQDQLAVHGIVVRQAV